MSDHTPVFDLPRPPAEGKEFTLEELQNHLQWAIYVEMCTIPLYLYAYYSIKPAGHGETARDAIKSVFREEMLHLALAGNTLYALGKPPTLYSPAHIPHFPQDILLTQIKMNLRDGRKDHIKTFVDVEAPSKPKPPPKRGPPALPEYKSIGDFYEAIKTQLEKHSSSITETKNQISTDDGIWDDNDLIVVSNLEKAKAAMNTIIVQGEGPAESDGGHHVIFLELLNGQNNWNYHLVVENPKTDDFEGKIFYEVLRTFDAVYCYLVLNIERLYRVSGDNRKTCSDNINTIMRWPSVLNPLAEFILGERVNDIDKTVAGPCFNYYPLDANTPLNSLKEEIAAAVGKYTGDRQKQLKDIQSTINGLKDLPAEDERKFSEDK